MRSVLNVLSWAGIVFLGLLNGVLEDLMFMFVMVPNFPMSWDLTGDLFWIFTVPVSQLMALAVTGTAAWFLGLRHPARLLTFWAVWSLARITFLNFAHNPFWDIVLILAWIAFWCALIGVLSRILSSGRAQDAIP